MHGTDATMPSQRTVVRDLLETAVAALALALALTACGTTEEDSARDAGPDAAAPFTQVFEIRQPADPGLQQLINSCASGFDQASCDAMCRRVICSFVSFPQLEVYACSLSRSGPIATITVTYNGPLSCPLPPVPPTPIAGRR